MASTQAEQMLFTTNSFLAALLDNSPSLNLLEFFSVTHDVAIQHAPAICPRPQSSRLTGLNAVRSYFDILAQHWVRVGLQIKGAPLIDLDARSVAVDASITWMWRQSRRQWTEEFCCTIAFDDTLKIISFIVRTNSGPETCVMRAKDIDRFEAVQGYPIPYADPGYI